jgi:hypothetical protein
MTVVNEFSKGKFEQTLDLIRVPDDLVVAQADPNATSTANSGFTAAVASDSQTFPTNNALTNPQQKPDGVETRSGRLIEAANGPATNPTPTEAGDGRPSATTAQPATAAPSNVNSAPNADVQQTNGLTQADYDNAVAGYTATFNAVVEERNNEVITFNSKLRAIRAEFTLTQAEKNQQIIALREALYPKLQGWFDQYKTLFQQVFALKNADGLIGKAKLDLLGNLNVFGKQVKEAIENQNEKIATLKADIENAVG